MTITNIATTTTTTIWYHHLNHQLPLSFENTWTFSSSKDDKKKRMETFSRIQEAEKILYRTWQVEQRLWSEKGRGRSIQPGWRRWGNRIGTDKSRRAKKKKKENHAYGYGRTSKLTSWIMMERKKWRVIYRIVKMQEWWHERSMLYGNIVKMAGGETERMNRGKTKMVADNNERLETERRRWKKKIENRRGWGIERKCI